MIYTLEHIKSAFNAGKYFNTYNQKSDKFEEFNLKEISNISYRDNRNCPQCESDDVKWIFCIQVGNNSSKGAKEMSKSICNKCGYEDVMGGFEEVNKINFRNKKIDSIIV